MDGFVTEDDVHTVVQVSEIVFCCWKLAGVVFWVIPVKQTTGRVINLLPPPRETEQKLKAD